MHFMQRFTSIAFRTLFFLGFLIVLPILAMPKVSSLVDRWLYDDKPTVVQAPLIEPPTQRVVEPQFAERASPAQYEASLVEDASAHPRRMNGLDNLAASPPLLNPLPSYTQTTSAYGTPPSQDAQLDDASVQRLHQVRERLEQLGAKYMILETASGSDRYRFHCEMLLEPHSTYIRKFDATSIHPVEAAESVLREVEGWRMAAHSPGTAQQ
jgi:hypothetical protein